jgi:ribosomal protein S18 acetylase RimI-like enzyme
MGREIRTLAGHSSYVLSVAVSPDARRIVSGSVVTTLNLWVVDTGREIRTLAGHSSSVNSVAVSPDATRLVSGSADTTLKLWDSDTGREIRTLAGHSSSVNFVAFSPDARSVVSGSADGTIKVWDAETGREIRTLAGHSSYVNSVAVSPDARRIVSGSGDGTIKVWDAETGREIRTLAGHNDWVRSVVWSPDARRIVSGSADSTLKIWDAETGREIRTLAGHSAVVLSVAVSPDARRLVSGSGDGTIKVWDAETGREIASFIGFTDGEWLVMSPDGYYNASAGGDRYLNVRINNEVYGIDQYRSTFYKPQVLEARLAGRPDPLPLMAAEIQDAASFEPPVVVIRSPEHGAALGTAQTELSVSIVDQRQPIKNITITVNGRLVGSNELGGLTGSRGLSVVNTGITVLGNENRVDFRFPLSLSPGTNRIEVRATNPYAEGRDAVELTYQTTAQNILPNLWILAIGINRYDTTQIQNLDYAVNDAREIINVFKAQEGKLYRQVNSLLIADGAAVTPTKDNIIDNLGFLKGAGQRDVVLLFIAGHGMNDDGGNYYFMPSDAAFNTDGSIRPSKAISYRDIQAVLDVPGQKLVFIDSCHSEGVSGRKTRGADSDQLVRALQDNSTVIFTASRGSELSQESREYGHGVFTYSIIQGMRGAADLIRDGVVTMKELDTYVSERVPQLTGGTQHPVTNTPDGYVNFTVADVK